MTQHEIVRDGVRIAYQSRGSGRPVVLIQGLSLWSHMWFELPDALAAAGYRVITVDNRGTGASSDASSLYRMATLADDVAAVLADGPPASEPATPEPALVVGISLGGMIAQHVALRHPSSVAGLVLAATTAGALDFRPPTPTALGALLGDVFLPPRFSVIERYVGHPMSFRRNPGLLSPIADALAEVPPRRRSRTAFAQLSAVLTHAAGPRLHTVACPAEIVTGSDDAIVPPENSRILARRIPDATLTVVPGTGHVFPLEDPQALPAAIQRVAERAWGPNGDADDDRDTRGA